MEPKDESSALPGIDKEMPTEAKKQSSKKSKKRKHVSDCSDSDDGKSKKSKSKHKKCKKRHKQSKDKKHKHSKSKTKSTSEVSEENQTIGPEVPNDILQKAQSMAPMSKEEWEKKQNTIRRVFDEETGRTRLVRGEGEIIEEIVSRDRHKQINRQATQGDGEFFQSNMKKYV